MLTRRQILASLFAVPAVKLLPEVGRVASHRVYDVSMFDKARGPVAVAAHRALRMAQSIIDTAGEVRACYPATRDAPVTQEHHLAALAACIAGDVRTWSIATEPPAVTGGRLLRSGPIGRAARGFA